MVYSLLPHTLIPRYQVGIQAQYLDDAIAEVRGGRSETSISPNRGLATLRVAFFSSSLLDRDSFHSPRFPTHTHTHTHTHPLKEIRHQEISWKGGSFGPPTPHPSLFHSFSCWFSFQVYMFIFATLHASVPCIGNLESQPLHHQGCPSCLFCYFMGGGCQILIFIRITQGSCSQTGAGKPALASPESLWETQILRRHPELLNHKLWFTLITPLGDSDMLVWECLT